MKFSKISLINLDNNKSFQEEITWLIDEIMKMDLHAEMNDFTDFFFNCLY